MTDFVQAHDGSVAGVRVFIASGVRAVREVALEVASIVGTAVTIAPIETGIMIVPHGPVASVSPWPERMRPIIDVELVADGPLTLGVFAAREHRVTRRMGGSAFPDVGVTFPVVALVDGGEVSTAPQDVDRAADVLGLPAERRSMLHHLAQREQAPVGPAELCAALGLSADVAAVLSRQRDIGTQLGAVDAERYGLWGTTREMLLARPHGSSLIARLRRLDHDRPAASVALIVIFALLAAVAVWLATSEGHTLAAGGWSALWWVCAAVLIVEVIGNVIMLTAVRRRARRQA